MQRAFEAQPSNAAIQGELQSLYARRDGVGPPKIRMTRGALARMYVQGELYPQAISEIRAVLSQEGDRPDMRLLLAQAHFRSGQRSEASTVCAELLRELPFCLDAHRILASNPAQGAAGNGRDTHKSRVAALDPYSALVKESARGADRVAESAIVLDRLEYGGKSGDAEPDWLPDGIPMPRLSP